MSWLKFETTTPDKVEVFELARILGLDPDAVVGKLLRVWAWFDQHTEDGSANVSGILLLDRLAGVAGFCDAMAQVDWLIIEDDAIGLPNFDRHNGHSAKNRLLSAERKRRERDNVAAKSRLNRDKSVTREEKRREEKNIPTTPSTEGDAESIDPLHRRLILCILSRVSGKKRPGAERKAWDKVKGTVTERDVKTLEEFYALPKSKEHDNTWHKKNGVAALLNQLTEQVEYAMNHKESESYQQPVVQAPINIHPAPEPFVPPVK